MSPMLNDFDRLRATTFDVYWRGYDVRDVQALLDRVATSAEHNPAGLSASVVSGTTFRHSLRGYGVEAVDSFMQDLVAQIENQTGIAAARGETLVLSVDEAASKLASLLDEVAAGAKVIITRDGRPEVRLVPTSSL